MQSAAEQDRQTTLGSRLRDASRVLGSRLEAELLMAMVLDKPRPWLIAHADQAVGVLAQRRFDWLVEKRLEGRPMAQLTGSREFYGREFTVTPDVLIPRPETEHLVEFALSLDLTEPARVADIGTGSGAVALTLAAERPGWTVVATDISAAALAVAAANRDRLALPTVELLHGDMYEPIAGRRFSLIVSNPPYIAHGDPHLDEGDLRFEPRVALTPGADSLGILRRLIEHAPAVLRRDGWLALEHGHDQASAVPEMLLASGFGQVHSIRDLAGIERVTAGRLEHPATRPDERQSSPGP